MKKTIYVAPFVEQIDVRFEQNIMSGDPTKVSAPAADQADMIEGAW